MSLKNAIVLIVSITIFLSLTGCQTYDNTVRKYGGGFKDGTTSYFGCIGVGGSPVSCGVVALAGYAGGKENARQDIKADDNQKLIKKLAEKQAKDQGVKINCKLLDLTCWDFLK